MAKKEFAFKKKHKNPLGGLSELGRSAYNRATGSNLQRPQPEGGSRKKSFCARMGAVAANAKDGERAKASLKRWMC